MKSQFTSATGAKYTIEPHPKSGWIVTRLPKGTTVKISASLVERTKARLQAGEAIPFRAINYTVAIETAVIHILGDLVKRDAASKSYILA